MGQIEAIVDFEVAEMIRFYGTIVGTEGVSEEIKTLCNTNIMKLLNKIQPKVVELTGKIITK